MFNVWLVLMKSILWFQDNGEREEVSLDVENTLWANTVIASGQFDVSSLPGNHYEFW